MIVRVHELLHKPEGVRSIFGGNTEAQDDRTPMVLEELNSGVNPES